MLKYTGMFILNIGIHILAFVPSAGVLSMWMYYKALWYLLAELKVVHKNNNSIANGDYMT